MSEIEFIINNIPNELWEKLKKNSRRSKRWVDRIWQHHKYYIDEGLDDGYKIHKFLTSNGNIFEEIPYERKLFFPSNGRFSLKNKSVAYFSDEFATCCCETIESFRNNENLSYKNHLEDYFNGKTNPTPGFICYLLKVKISGDTLLLNLTDDSNPIIQFIQNQSKSNNYTSFFKNVILSRNQDSYKPTQFISNCAYSKGFHGIVFKSVRTENDMAHPDSNLVVFDESKVKIFNYSFEKVSLNNENE